MSDFLTTVPQNVRNMDADSAFAVRAIELDEQLELLKKNFKKFAAQQQSDKNNWGYVGTMTDMIQSLMDINCRLGK